VRSPDERVPLLECGTTFTTSIHWHQMYGRPVGRTLFQRRGGLLVETGFSDSRVIDAVRVLLIVSSCFQNSNGGGASSTSKSRGGARKRSMTDQCSPPPLRT